jgi:hypothetical protein
MFLGVLVAILILGGLGLGLFGYVQLRDKIVVRANHADDVLGHLIGTGNTLVLHHEGLLAVSRAKRKAEYDAAASNLPSLRLAILAPLNALAAIHASEGQTTQEAKNHLQDLGKAINAYLKYSEGALSAFDESYSESVPVKTRRLFQNVGMLATANEVRSSYAIANGRLWEASGKWQVEAKRAQNDQERVLLGSTLFISLILILGTWHILIREGIRLIAGSNHPKTPRSSPQAEPGEDPLTDQQRDLIERQVLRFIATAMTGKKDGNGNCASAKPQKSLPESK